MLHSIVSMLKPHTDAKFTYILGIIALESVSEVTPLLVSHHYFLLFFFVNTF